VTEQTRPPGIHHVAYACRDVDETVDFYENLIGFPLVHTEVDGHEKGYMRHLFFDTGDRSALAFFQLHNMGERKDFSTAISTGNGLPVWVNHIAFGATEEFQKEVRGRLDAAGIDPVMEVDHGWCHSLYYLDPNQILIEFCRDTPGFEPNPEEAHALLTATVRPRPPANVIIHKGAEHAPNP
jgi:catechol 2,3-dioxygenase-like lactoylglutathione lyase family enzyme